jgi:ADP-ribose pyrophosphatase YjhB (NUDIX family)
VVRTLAFWNINRGFLVRRALGSRNEVETWEFPGGEGLYGELLEDAVHRE